MKVKKIMFRLNLEGFGVVNYDSNDQKWIWNKHANDMGKQYIGHDNVSLAKKNWYLDNDNKISYKIKISSNCLRKGIFTENEHQSPNLISSNILLTSFIATPVAILRGYVFTEKDKCSIKKDSILSITDAEQTNSAVSNIEFFSKSGEKVSDDNKSDPSLFSKETIGDIKYKSHGDIMLDRLQFMSFDSLNDRLSLNPDNFELFKTILKNRIPSFNSELGYYQKINDCVNIPEYGIVFSDEDINILVKYLLKNMLSINISRAKAYANTNSLEIKFVYDVINDKRDDEDGWIKVTEDVIDNLSFETQMYYKEESGDVEELRKELVSKSEERKEKNRIEKEEKAKLNKEKKSKKLKESQNEVLEN